MRVSLRGVDYRIRFEFSQTRRRQTTKAIIETKVTKTLPGLNGMGITQMSKWEPVMTGESHCHPVDVKVYNRTLGKRKALDRCFLDGLAPDGEKVYHTPEDDRELFWAAFNGAHPEKKKAKHLADIGVSESVNLLEALASIPGVTVIPVQDLQEGDDDVF